MPQDTPRLRANLQDCFPSLVIEEVAAQSGQRVVYFGHFNDSLIPADVAAPGPDDPAFLHGWGAWGRVVIKVVGGASADALTRLQAETAILTELRPQNFPSLLFCDLFLENPVTDEPLPETLYVSIEEFVVSRPLSQCLADYHGNPGAILDLCLGVANALMPLWMHPKRFVHRDIKPANILVKPNGQIVVIDLGIVRETGGTGITRDGWGNAPLTLDFAAPEQIANDKDAISFKSDFFALGVLMYLLLAGRHPFHHPEQMAPHELALAIEQTHPPTLIELGAASQDISDLVEQLMRKEPYRRPRTPDILIEQMRVLRENQTWR